VALDGRVVVRCAQRTTNIWRPPRVEIEEVVIALSPPQPALTKESTPDRLVERVPELFDTYVANDEKFGAPYTFMMLAAAWTRELANTALAAEERRTAADPILQRLFGFIERALHSPDQRVTDLVVTGLLEGLNPAEAYYGVLEAYMGPATRREQDIQTNWRYL
jgi:hypothetical protein